mmetsp:Transcript_5646/g.14108  ORF Transcript_5646/g.14108 Transcript_5646/m.14108 type:complete len:233 (+) Transcript_5646:320-1018(+)
MFRRPLEGPRINRHYFPSKFAFQSFHLDEYLQMQHDRFRGVYRKNLRVPQGQDDPGDTEDTVEETLGALLERLREPAARAQARAELDGLPPPDDPMLDGGLTQLRLSPQQRDDLRDLLQMAEAKFVREQDEHWDNYCAQQGEDGEQRHEDVVHLDEGKVKVDRPPASSNIKFRFVDPMFRRRRVKWLERFSKGVHRKKEKQYNAYYLTHPDEKPVWPDNYGSVTVRWPNAAM